MHAQLLQRLRAEFEVRGSHVRALCISTAESLYTMAPSFCRSAVEYGKCVAPEALKLAEGLGTRLEPRKSRKHRADSKPNAKLGWSGAQPAIA